MTSTITADTLNNIRPQSISEFVGQDHLKSLITGSVTASKKRNAPFPHSLVTGAAGLGKTSLARLIAAAMEVVFVVVTAEALEDFDAVKGLLSQLDDTGYDSHGQPTGTIKPSLILLDEAHRLSRASQELLYACLEDRVIESKVKNPLTGLTQSVREWVPHFTLIAASNRPGDLTTALRDRLRLHLRIEPYSETDSAKIAKQALGKMELKCSKKCAELIAARGRGVPRKIISICEMVRDMAFSKGTGSVSPALCAAAFEAMCLDPIGLTRLDIELLRFLARQPAQPMGLRTISSLLHEDPGSIEENTEPYLLHKGLIARKGRGRAITSAGLEHLQAFHGFKVEGRTLTP